MKIITFFLLFFLNSYLRFPEVFFGIPSGYAPQTGELKPVFEGKDKQRRKVNVILEPVFSGLPQITSLVEFPLNPVIYIATIKTGELMAYNFSTKKSFLIKKFQVLTASEQGLLGIAFHPEFSKNRLMYLHYSAGKQNKKYGRISEFPLLINGQVDGNIFSLGKERILLEIEQPYSNHNGGHLEFGPDKYLYIGLGDGGWRDDPHNYSQNPESLLGKMLRIDVRPSANKPYSIPPDNPYTVFPEWREEIFATGLRNPWKFSFDPVSGRLVVADVGQDQFEEISIVEKGKNYGWRIKEGYSCYLDRHLCDRKDLVDPVYVYDHSEGQSITGGYVYTAGKIPELTNKYIFGDFVQGKIWAMDLPAENNRVQDSDVIALGKYPVLISTFARTSEGEVLVADYRTGKIYSIVKK